MMEVGRLLAGWRAGRHLIRPAWAAMVLVGVLLYAACVWRGAATDAYGEGQAMRVQGGSVVVEMRDIRFHPQGIRLRPGTTVTWVNRDPVVHNVRQVEGRFLSPDVMQPGETFSFTFREPGRFRYQCTLHHPYMNGVVIVEEGSR